jgi:hypothetical protein
VEYQVRAARITDVDRLVAICGEQLRASRGDGNGGALDPADMLRQLVFLPQATVLVAETGRGIVGGAVLALRPSVRAGGFVGTVDLLAVEAGDPEAVEDVLIEEMIRSAANKACVAIEATASADPNEHARWDRNGFRGTGPTIRRRVAPKGDPTGTTAPRGA